VQWSLGLVDSIVGGHARSHVEFVLGTLGGEGGRDCAQGSRDACGKLGKVAVRLLRARQRTAELRRNRWQLKEDDDHTRQRGNQGL